MTALSGTSSVAGTPGCEGVNTAGGLGVLGVNTSGNSGGVQGTCQATTGTGCGVYGVSSASSGAGVLSDGAGQGMWGRCSSALSGGLNAGYGMIGTATGYEGIGLWGHATAQYGTGVYGQSEGAGGNAFAGASYGTAVAANCLGTNVSCISAVCSTASTSNSQIALYGTLSNSFGYAVYGNGAGYFNGPCSVTGYLSKAGGGYRIDHPTDPENKYLNHCFVESPEMMNCYRGSVVLDGRGDAVVQMPSYFTAACKDCQYQLTPMGASMPNLFVLSEMDWQTGQWIISGGAAGRKVSWTVTAARADKWAAASHPGVEVEKTADEKGRYLHPGLFGKDDSAHVSQVARDEVARLAASVVSGSATTTVHPRAVATSTVVTAVATVKTTKP